ncbi:MAG: hypothetical protein K2I30_04595 [Clostridia bacterium]|nr:hypothetical protein [Clostridia bacterium]
MKTFANMALLASSEFNSVGQLLADFLNSWWGPLLIVIGACGGILGVIAGFKWWFAHASGDENKVKSAKQFAIGVIIGFVIIFVLAALIPVLVAAFSSWFDSQGV